jgi:hypothetical protein
MPTNTTEIYNLAMFEIGNDNNAATHLDDDIQRTQEQEVNQMEADIAYEDNARIERIIEAFDTWALALPTTISMATLAGITRYYVIPV